MDLSPDNIGQYIIGDASLISRGQWDEIKLVSQDIQIVDINGNSIPREEAQHEPSKRVA